MSLIPKEVIDKLEDTQSALHDVVTRLDTVVEHLSGIHEQLKLQNERQT